MQMLVKMMLTTHTNLVFIGISVSQPCAEKCEQITYYITSDKYKVCVLTFV